MPGGSIVYRPALLRRKHFDRAGPNLNRANQIMFVANNPLAAVRKSLRPDIHTSGRNSLAWSFASTAAEPLLCPSDHTSNLGTLVDQR